MPDFWEPSRPVVLFTTIATESFEGDLVGGFRRYRRIKLTLHVVAAAATAVDTLDVFVDVDGVPAVHFTQILGTDPETTLFAFLEAGLPAATDFDVSTDPAAGVVRPYVWGDELKVRGTVVDGGAHGQSFTFEVIAEAQV
ncbi:MAG: hypothetical protein JXA87_13115 [Thermoleophilia bacterium]|nr:hypothetical protein [Thermoleophilia bacterium]